MPAVLYKCGDDRERARRHHEALKLVNRGLDPLVALSFVVWPTADREAYKPVSGRGTARRIA